MKSLLPRRTVIMIIIAVAVNGLYPDMNRLSCYGVGYTDIGGGSESNICLQFYRNYRGTRIIGPQVGGTWPFVTYDDVDHDGIPEIIVKSRAEKSSRAVIKLNLSDDPTEPAFQVLKNTIKVGYPPQGLPNWP